MLDNSKFELKLLAATFKCLQSSTVDVASFLTNLISSGLISHVVRLNSLLNIVVDLQNFYIFPGHPGGDVPRDQRDHARGAGGVQHVLPGGGRGVYYAAGQGRVHSRHHHRAKEEQPGKEGGLSTFFWFAQPDQATPTLVSMLAVHNI